MEGRREFLIKTTKTLIEKRILSAEQQKHVALMSGEAHPELSEQIAKHLGSKLGSVALRAHPNSEPYVRYEESIRGRHVVIMQPHVASSGRSSSDALHQHLEMINAAKLSSASEVTAVCTHLSGARQDRKSRGREAISGANTIRLLGTAGATRIVAVDLHSPQVQGVFNGPFDHLTAQPLLRQAVQKKIAGNSEDYVVVTPDVGHAKMSDYHARQLGVGIEYMVKSRDRENSGSITRETRKIPGVAGKNCLIFDDMLDTAGTLVTAAERLHDSKAKTITFAGTHGFFSEPAIERVQDSPVDQIFITDTLPVENAQMALGDRLQIVSVSNMVADALYEIVTDGSVSAIFDDQNHM